MPIDPVAGAIGGQFLGTALGGYSARQGAKIDTRAKLGQESQLYDRAMDRGLTPQEYYGSPAPGNPSSSGAGQIIGNQANAMSAQLTQATIQSKEREKDRQNAKEIAGIQAGVQTAGQENQAQIEANKLALQKQQFTQIALKESAAKLKINEQELKAAVNNVTTSSPKWHLMLKNLSMGPDNMWVQSYIEHTGINPITDPEAFRKLPKSEREKFLLGFLAYASHTNKEAAGIISLLGLDKVDHQGAPLLGAQNPPRPPQETIYSNPFFTIRRDKKP